MTTDEIDIDPENPDADRPTPLAPATLFRVQDTVAVTAKTPEKVVVLGILLGMQPDGRWMVACADNAVRFRYDWQLQSVQPATLADSQ